LQFREDFALPNFRFSAGAKSIILALKRLQSPYKGLTTALSRNLLPQSTTNEFSYPVSRLLQKNFVFLNFAATYLATIHKKESLALCVFGICFYFCRRHIEFTEA
jgi:hypothetical protein